MSATIGLFIKCVNSINCRPLFASATCCIVASLARCSAILILCGAFFCGCTSPNRMCDQVSAAYDTLQKESSEENTQNFLSFGPAVNQFFARCAPDRRRVLIVTKKSDIQIGTIQPSAETGALFLETQHIIFKFQFKDIKRIHIRKETDTHIVQ